MKKLNSVYDIHVIHEKMEKMVMTRVFFFITCTKTYYVVFISKK